ncbi:MAG: hypothetical protein FWD28_09705, partial [Treponema sp.]|nr:hypothetical protein [Treponema sp.]
RSFFMKKKNLFGMVLIAVMLMTGFAFSSCETFDDFAYGYSHGRGWLNYDEHQEGVNGIIKR